MPHPAQREKSRSGPSWKPSGFCVLRSPLLPLQTLLRLSASLEAPGCVSDAPALERAVMRDRDASVAALRDIVRTDPVVREALFIASPSLDAGIDAWLGDASSARARGVPEIVLRYVARMAARSTPFGLFSGCSLGSLGARTQLTLAPRSAYRRHSRLDVHYLDALSEALLEDADIRRSLPMRPSTGAYATVTHYRHAESHTDAATRARQYQLVSVARTPYLDATLARAANGASLDELARALTAAEPEITREEATAFVDEVVRAQLLASELTPAVTGAEPLRRMIETLRAIEPGKASAALLADVAGRLQGLDAEGLGHPASRYRDVVSVLDALPARPDLARLFHVDLYKPAAEVQLGAGVLREIERAIAVLARVTPPRDHEDLRRFREAFVERYEAREVPLVQVLDEELGIGFSGEGAGSAEPSPWIEDLPFPERPAAPRVEIGPRERHLARGIDATLRAGSLEWSLTPDDIDVLGGEPPAELPDAFAFFGAIAARSAEAADRGELDVHVHGVTGPSGANLLGRFCHGDPALRERVEAHLRAEEALRPDAIFAEIVHLPEGRLGNILGRPRLREFEIAYLGSGGAGAPHRILVDDLLVSVREGRIVLRSRRLGREIVPRLTSAHNFSGSVLGVYRFLCALQLQGSTSLSFSWGPFTDAPFLPRVRVGRAVLSPASWNLSKADLAPLVKGTAAKRYIAIRRLRERLHLPRWVGLTERDNVLPVDLDQALHLDAFAQLAKSRDAVRLVELAMATEDKCARGPEGQFTHEIVVPFVRDAGPEPTPAQPMVGTPGARTFAPGSEWLYAKFYTGSAAVDAVLREVVAPLLGASAISSWFFIRYGDPRWHLRVRFRGDPAYLHGDLLRRIHEAVAPRLADGSVWRLQLDTYEREVERYGGPVGIELSEAIFHADSEAVMAVIAGIAADDGNRTRCDLTVYGVHLLLCDLGLELPERLAAMRRMRQSFAREHRVDVEFERRLGMMFRARRAAFEAIVAGEVRDEGRRAFDVRGQRVAAIAEKLREARDGGALSVPVETLAESYVHMHVNRMLRADHRAQELVVYDVLERLYDAQVARARKRGQPDRG